VSIGEAIFFAEKARKSRAFRPGFSPAFIRRGTGEETDGEQTAALRNF
jgi:hypothetical protein